MQLLQHRAKDESGIVFITGGGEDTLSYAALFHRARAVLGTLQQKGLRPGDELVLQVNDAKTFLTCFWACILGGIVPVPLAVGRNNEQLLKLVNVWAYLNNPSLVISPDDLAKFGKAAGDNPGLRCAHILGRVILTDELAAAAPAGRVHEPGENEIAYIQFSSGSTSTPKGVTLTHANLLTNLRAILAGIESPPAGDVFLSWMPLTHDMGLIGYHLAPMLAGWTHYLMPTELFIRNPALWLQKISEHRITFTASPNFGYKYVLSYLDPRKLKEVDLSCLRIITNGAEPISADLCRLFVQELRPYGLRENVIFPVYGLAEASLAVTFSRPGASIKTIRADRRRLGAGEQVRETGAGEHGIAFVNVGVPLPGNCRVRITDDNRELPDWVIGHVQLKGNNVTAGYYNNEQATAAAFAPDGWLDTGDLGFTGEGQLYITGRAKDIIFVNGQNVYPHDIEYVAEQEGGIEAGKIAVAGTFNHESGKEEIIAFVVHRGKPEQFIPVAARLEERVNQAFGFGLDKVLPVAAIPKTTSGKIQRYKLIEQYREGAFAGAEAQLNRRAGHQPVVLPQNDTEQRLYALWREVLPGDALGVTHRFFEAGGNSLKGARLLNRVGETLGVNLTFSELYENQSVREMARVVGQRSVAPPTPIRPLPPQPDYPLSAAQKVIYYFWATNPASVAYNIPVALRVAGKPDVGQLGKAIGEIVERNEVLRTSFAFAGGEPRQVVWDRVPFSLSITDVSPGALDGELRKRVVPFDLRRAPLFRVDILRLADDDFVLFTDFHHIVFDGFSYDLFYAELLKGCGTALPAVQYKDFAAWESEQWRTRRFAEAERYWTEQFGGEVAALNLPTDFARSPARDFGGGRLECKLGATLSERLRQLAAEKQVTPYVVWLAAYQVFLAKCTGQQEIVVGTPCTVRDHPDLQHPLGMFVNSLALKSTVRGEETFEAFLAGVQRNFLAALDHRQYPFEKLVQQVARFDLSRSPVFDTMLTYQNYGATSLEGKGLVARKYFFDPGIAKYDLSLEVFEESDGFTCYFEYATQLFRRETAVHLFGLFRCLLEQVAAGAGRRVSALSLLSAEGVARNVYGFNRTRADYPAGVPVHQLVKEQARRSPAGIAVVDGDKTLTYRELDSRSDQLARLLRQRGAGPDVPVALLLERSRELVIAMMAVLKAGGAYLPLEPALPGERIRYLLTDSRAPLLIAGAGPLAAHQAVVGALTGVSVIALNDPADIPAPEGEGEPDAVAGPGHLAYLIYTSGTTGQPKGVMIEHRSLVNYAWWAAKRYLRDEKPCFPLYTSIAFDLTVTSVFVPLLAGGTIVVFREEEGSSQPLIGRVMADPRITTVKTTPAHLKLLNANARLTQWRPEAGNKTFIVGGEDLPAALARQVRDLFGEGVEIYNEYGPTEATVGCMIHRYDPDADTGNSVPVGTPIDNTLIYLLDPYQQPVPEGIVGEMYIAGDCLARGYLHNPDLSATRFVDDPFAPGRKMYRTGDLALRLPDGKVKFAGRADEQVKLNGYRIELGEIESHLLRHEAVSKAVALKVKGRDNDGYLCAYYVCKPAHTATPTDLGTFLSHWLPAYMLPACYVPVPDIPLTLNGKVNVKALPPPQAPHQPAQQDRDLSELERILCEVWQDVLGLDAINTESRFFEMGGDSIKAVQVAARLFERDVTVQARDILVHQTIGQLVASGAVAWEHYAYEQGPVAGTKGLSPVESWFFGQNLAQPAHYNQSVLLRMKRPLDQALLTEAFRVLIGHHDGLRLNYDPAENVLRFNNELPGSDFRVEVCDISGIPPAEKPGAISRIGYRLKSSVNMTGGNLLQAAYLRDNDGPDLLLVSIHHLGVDGHSWRVLLEDLKTAYLALESGKPVRLPRKTASLKDWYEALVTRAAGGEVAGQLPYWREVEAAAREQRNAPAPGSQPAGRISRTLDQEKTAALLNDVRRHCNADVATLLLTALTRTLPPPAGGADLVIEMEHHGRTLAGVDASRTVGWFTAMYPLRLSLPRHGNLREQVQSLKEQLAAVPDAGIGYGLLRYLARSLGEGPAWFNLRFNYLGEFSREVTNELFAWQDGDTGPDTSPRNAATVPLEINALVLGGVLQVEAVYDPAAYPEGQAACLLEDYLRGLEDLPGEAGESTGDAEGAPLDFQAAGLDQEDLDVLFGD